MGDVTRSVTQYKAKDDDMAEADAKAHAAMMLRDQFRANGEVIDSDPVAGEPRRVVLNADMTGWEYVPPNAGYYDGVVIEWTATGYAEAGDPTEPEPGRVEDGVYVVDLADDTRLLRVHGGPVRIRHGLGTMDVLVRCYDGGEGTGYLFAQPLTPDEVHVELGQHTTRVTVEPDDVDG